MKKYMAMAVVATMFASCSNDDTLLMDVLTDTPIIVDAGVASLATRAGIATGNLQEFGLTILNAGNDKYSYRNVKYVKSGTVFIPEGNIVPLWQNAEQEVTVLAYAPYHTDWTYKANDVDKTRTFTVQANQSQAGNDIASDLLWAQATLVPSGTTSDKTVNYEANALKVSLQHLMSKLVINVVRLGTELETEPKPEIESVVVKELENACILDLTTGSLTLPIATASVKKDIIAHKEVTVLEDYDATYEAIFPPQEASFQILVNLADGRNFVTYNTCFSFQPGYAYTIDLVVGEDKADSKSITARSWAESY